MGKDRPKIVDDFFNQHIGVSVTTREEYDSLFDLLKELDPDMTWRDGDDLSSYDAFLMCRENTYIAYDNSSDGVMYGDIEDVKTGKIITYDEFKILVNGECLSFEEILFGREGGRCDGYH